MRILENTIKGVYINVEYTKQELQEMNNKITVKAFEFLNVPAGDEVEQFLAAQKLNYLALLINFQDFPIDLDEIKEDEVTELKHIYGWSDKSEFEAVNLLGQHFKKLMDSCQSSLLQIAEFGNQQYKKSLEQKIICK